MHASRTLGAISLLVLLSACADGTCEDMGNGPVLSTPVAAQSTPMPAAAPVESQPVPQAVAYSAPVAAPAPAPVAAPAPAAAPVATATAAAPFAADNGPAGKPLVVIRFGQNKNANFRQTLTDAVAQAEKAKPGAHYDVVSYVPVSGSAAQDQSQANETIRNQKSVTDQMIRQGVQSSRITISSRYTPASSMGEQETQVFVH